MLSIDEKKGSITFRHNKQTQTLSLAQPDTPEGSAVETIGAKELPAGGLKFWTASLEEFLRQYANLCGREPLPIESNPPQTGVHLRSQTTLTTAEAIYALDVLAAINGWQFVLVGDKQVKLVRGQ